MAACPRSDRALHADLQHLVYERIGWDPESLALWHYCGDGTAYLAGYPIQAPGSGRIDVSAMVLTGALSALRGYLSRSCL